MLYVLGLKVWKNILKYELRWCNVRGKKAYNYVFFVFFKGVKYSSVAEHFPLTRLELWSRKDGVSRSKILKKCSERLICTSLSLI